MSDVEALKARAGEVVDELRDELVELSSKMHADVELAFEEVKASGWITDLLQAHGLRVDPAVLSRFLCRRGFTYKKSPDGLGMRASRHPRQPRSVD